MTVVTVHAALPLLEKVGFNASSVGFKIQRRLYRPGAFPRLMGTRWQCRNRSSSHTECRFGSPSCSQNQAIESSNAQQYCLRFAQVLHSKISRNSPG